MQNRPAPVSTKQTRPSRETAIALPGCASAIGARMAKNAEANAHRILVPNAGMPAAARNFRALIASVRRRRHSEIAENRVPVNSLGVAEGALPAPAEGDRSLLLFSTSPGLRGRCARRRRSTVWPTRPPRGGGRFLLPDAGRRSGESRRAFALPGARRSPGR